MLDESEYGRWHAMAVDAAAAAQDQLSRASHHWACFLAEQASQFGCKALLHGLGLPAWGHDLVELGRRISADGELSVPEDILDALTRLSRHYIASRYPDAHPAGTPSGHYRRADAEQALDDMRRLMTFADQRWAGLLREAEEQRLPDDE